MDLFFAGIIVASTILSNMDNRGGGKKRKKRKRGDSNYKDAYGWSHDHHKKLF